MARDYAKSSKTGNKRKRSAPAAKRRGKKQPAGIPLWVWVFSGLCLTFVVAAGVYIFGRPVDRQAIEISGVPAVDEPMAGGKEEQAEPEQPTIPGARFDFYQMLPNSGDMISRGAHTGDTGGGASASAPEPTPAPEPEPAPETQPSPVPTVHAAGRYVIQAGSFLEYSDANQREARLALLGIRAKIHKATLADGRTVFRVRTLPTTSLEALNDTLQTLNENNIGTLVVHYGG